MSTASRRRQSRARASFGPEWGPLPRLAAHVSAQVGPRSRSKIAAHVRASRRLLAEENARWTARARREETR